MPAAWLYPRIAQRLAAVGDVFCLPGGGGLVVVPPTPDIPPMEVTNGGLLGAVIKDRVPLVLFKNGKPKGSRLPPADLNDMVRCKLFLSFFQTVDRVAVRPEYVGNFEMTRPGYNEGAVGHRVYYAGPSAEVAHSRDAIERFLDVMAFASNADRTNTVAAALTVTMRHFWPGQKPVILATSTKSHGGKDTVLDFAAGDTPGASISYESADWAVQREFVKLVKEDPTLGFVRVENVRLDSTGKQIASAFLERFVADPNPVLHATGTGKNVRCPNHWVVGMSTNFGVVSKDIMNRALPIHLTPTGDVASRSSPIGNPRWEYLRDNRARIAAELRGMVARWKAAGSPLGPTGVHPMSEWASVIGGILEENGFRDFLANYPIRLSADDPAKYALALLGLEVRGQWRGVGELAPLVAHLGLSDRLIPKGERESIVSRQRALAKVIDAHASETFVAEANDEVVRLRLDRRKGKQGGATSVEYRFADLDQSGDATV